ncbi:MAG: PaaI family thioesterase [Actinomycetota bacterium]|nr:PaaI family thioesterase [Actinomycetota bacterium]
MTGSERDRTTRLSAAEITAFLDEVFPGSMEYFVIEDVRPMRARVRMVFNEFRLRPGGTISGPSLMMLADTGLWVALLAMIGREPLSVTSHLDIDFLRKPGPADVIAETTLHKIGKRLAVGDVLMYSAGESAPCARASVTYAIPSVRLDPPVE